MRSVASTGRQYAKTITNIQEELLIALRDVAGLSWSGDDGPTSSDKLTAVLRTIRG